MYCTAHLTVSGLAILPIEVGPVTVLVPPGPFVGQGTVGHGDVIVTVLRGEGPTLMVGKRVAWNRRDQISHSHTVVSKLDEHHFLFVFLFLDVI